MKQHDALQKNDAHKVLALFVEALRKKIPNSGVSMWMLTETGIMKVCPEMPWQIKLTPKRLDICKATAKELNAGRRVQIWTKVDELFWQEASSQYRAWTVHQIEIDAAKYLLAREDGWCRAWSYLPDLAFHYSKSGKTQLAKYCLEQYEALIEDERYGDDKTNTYASIGEDYLKIGQLESARRMLAKAQALGADTTELSEDLQFEEGYIAAELKELHELIYADTDESS